MDTQGIYEKFVVTRTDGKDKMGAKHCHCAYFVLDLIHDKFAPKALAAYAKACKKERPDLSNDLTKYVEYSKKSEKWSCHCGARGLADCRCIPPAPPTWLLKLEFDKKVK
jgi:hypothetical protein